MLMENLHVDVSIPNCFYLKPLIIRTHIAWRDVTDWLIFMSIIYYFNGNYLSKKTYSY